MKTCFTSDCVLCFQIAKLKQENELCFRNLVQQVKENEKLMDEAEKVHKDVVERALEDKFLYMKNSEKEVEGTYVCSYVRTYVCVYAHVCSVSS